ncbi:hypothetical protein [Arcticibacterium luteifluviistationis]|uniref:Uncharacterized protein n=1 Tax=Arcticibacterium luteifluviistationis TaxID=1784714 RepID=A0A2Z4G7G9_9BACT|nr:hypothetical protein [Arcticibacterium luteifluviistationis]AWV97099.1 hypothetical protein DJ013_02475 [Arcticibacterium luteifluviistationis]
MKLHKAIRFITLITVLIIQIVFLSTIVKEKYETDHYTAALSILFIAVTIIFGYRYLDLHHEEYSYEKISVAIWVPIGAVACYLLNSFTGFGSVLSAGILGTLASFIPAIKKESLYFEKLPPAIYCGAFVGMSSVEIAPSINYVIDAGVLAGIFLMLSKSLFLGIGGKLGTIAFGGVALVSLLYSLLS